MPYAQKATGFSKTLSLQHRSTHNTRSPRAIYYQSKMATTIEGALVLYKASRAPQATTMRLG